MRKITLLATIFTFFFCFTYAQNFNFDFRSEVVYDVSCASIWGYVDDAGNEYALVGTYNGVSIVDVTDPDNPNVLFNVDHTPSLWRELKTYGHYCYATNESGGGLLIIDLSDLPNSVQQYSFTYEDEDGHIQESGHTLWIDENGRLYIFGGGYGAGGATMFDLTVDALNPPFVGAYEQKYIHDGFVRGDTLWASEIFNGQLELVDVSNPAFPVPMVSQQTPNQFTHNSWPTHDNHYVFTTDEVDNSYLTSYDVSDLSNITELDRVQSNPGSNVIIHNVHLYNDQFAVVAYYKDGVVIFDVLHPDNMIEVASYDTDPAESGGEYGGTWGVYPWLPSGNIIASDLYDGGPNGKLTVLTPTYVSACWLEGTVTDFVTGGPINGANAEILTTSQSDLADLSGVYKTGLGVAGTYTVRFSKIGYVTKDIANVSLSSGIVTTLDVQLEPLVATTITGTVLDSLTNLPVANALVYLRGVPVGFTYDVVTDASGNFSVSPLYEGSYDAFAGKWGYHEKGVYNTYLDQNSGPLQFLITPGYYDDFILNQGWTISGNAATGQWERAEPVGTYDGSTQYNPEEDLAGDWGDYCYTTGNAGGGIGEDDVDDGKTLLTSPVFDVSGYDDPVISFYSWFANGGGSGTPNDTLNVYLNDGVTTVVAAHIKFPTSQWLYQEIHINEYMAPTATMQIKFQASDLSNSPHVVEAALDVFRIDNGTATGINNGYTSGIQCNAFPNPFNTESIIQFDLTGQSFSEARLEVYNSIGMLVETHPIVSAKGMIKWGSQLENGIYLAKIVIEGKAAQVISSVKIK